MYKQLKLKNSTLNYLDIGEGFPILFGHSFLWTHQMWHPQIEDLSKNYRLIVPDLWGHGDSGVLPKDTKNLTDIADDMLNLLNHLDIQEFGVIGLSVGGMWAAEMAFKNQSKIKLIVLMDTFIGSEPDNSKKQYLELLDSIEKSNSIPEPIITTVAPNFFSEHTRQIQSKLIPEFIDKLRTPSNYDIKSVVQLGRIIFERPNHLDKLNKVNIRTLIITGKDDIYRPPEEGQKMAELMPNAEFLCINNAGHISNLEQPQEINTKLRSFIADIL